MTTTNIPASRSLPPATVRLIVVAFTDDDGPPGEVYLIATATRDTAGAWSLAFDRLSPPLAALATDPAPLHPLLDRLTA